MKTKVIPKSLARKGITSVTDNLPSGAWLNVSKDFFLLFRPELEIRLIKRKKPTRITHF